MMLDVPLLTDVRLGLALTSATCSLLGSCVIIISFLVFKTVRTHSRCIVVIMSIADVMVSLPTITGVLRQYSNPSRKLPADFCECQSFFVTTGTQLSLTWTAGLAQHLCLLTFGLVEQVPLGFTFMLLLSSGVVIENVWLLQKGILGEVKGMGMSWCWIKTGTVGGNLTSPTSSHLLGGGGIGDSISDSIGESISKFGAVGSDVTMTGGMANCNYLLWNGKVLEIACYLLVFVFYALLYQRVSHLRSNHGTHHSQLLSTTGKIIAIPFVFILVRLWGTAAVLWFVVNGCIKPENPAFAVLISIMAFFDVSQGWVNFILYFLTTKHEMRLLERLKLMLRSVAYVRRVRRPHSSQNSYLTFNSEGGTHSQSRSRQTLQEE